MKKFNDIKNKAINESDVTLDKYIKGLTDLRAAAKDKNHALVTSKLITDYYQRAIHMGNDNKFFDAKIRRKINKANKDFKELGDDMKKEHVIVYDNLGIILDYLTKNENAVSADLGSVNGMGDVSLPSIDGELGSGDVPGGSTGSDLDVSTQEPSETIAMKKFDDIKEAKKDEEVYIKLTDLGDAASLISLIGKELTKRNPASLSDVIDELTNIEVSYNGLSNPMTLSGLARILDISVDKVKKTIDKVLDKNIHLLESLQVEFMTLLLTNPDAINESILGRALGGVAGFALGPKVGKIISKVLGIEKGPLYNVLTSRVVSAALAQELTKNLI